MGLDLVAVLRRLGVSIDDHSPPISAPGVITWLGRIFDVTPDQYKLGMIEGMEIWSTGYGFAPLDLVGVETWLFDAPRGDHLIIAERKVNFDVADAPKRDGRTLKIWALDDFAAFIGHAIIDGRLQILDEEEEVAEKSESGLFEGEGPFVLKPKNDFSVLESKGLEISLSKPVLVPAKLHEVRGLIKGPGEEEIHVWVLNCGGLHLVEEFELLERPPMINHEFLPIDRDPDFSDLLSQRRPHKDGMGDLLYWWKFESDTSKINSYDVLIPAHKGIDAAGGYWIFDGVTCTLHLNQ